MIPKDEIMIGWRGGELGLVNFTVFKPVIIFLLFLWDYWEDLERNYGGGVG